MNKLWINFLSICLFFIVSCTPNGEQYKHGQKLYEAHCESCHMVDGTGLGANIPPLAASDYLKQRQSSIACIIKYGIEDSLTVNGIQYTEKMIGIPQLSEFEMANIINFINHAWGNDFGYVKIETLKENLENCQ